MRSTLSINERLDELAKMLVSEKEFKKTYTYFFDNLTDDDAFMMMAERTQDPDFKKIMQAVGQGFLQQTSVTITKFLSMPLPAQQFVHGVCHIDGRLATFFFFKEISMGMAAMVTPGGEYNTLFARFTTFETPDKRIAFHSLAAPGDGVH